MIIMYNISHEHGKWEKFKGAMKKAGKWTVRNLLPVAVSLASGGFGLPVALGGLASELFKKFSDAKINLPISGEVFKEKLEELCKGEGKPIEFLQEKIEQANNLMTSADIKLVIEHVMTPVVYEMSTMLAIMNEEKADLQVILAGWLDDQSQLIQNEFTLSHEHLYDIQNEMLNGFQYMNLKQTQILENINNIQSKMQFELVNFKRELSELIQAVFGQSVQIACDLDTMFNLATVHFNHQNLASRFDLPYNPDLYVRPESFFGSMANYLSDFIDPMKKNIPVFLLLAHLGMGKTWNFAYITEYLLTERNIAIPFFINLKDGLQQQLYGIFKTQNMGEIVDRCQKIKSETKLPIFLILDGLDELTYLDLRDVLQILKQLLLKRTDALCVALSCRIIAWVQDQQILNERGFFEEHVWPDQRCPDWKAQFDIATPISCVLGEFLDFELDAAIDLYGLKRQNFSPGLYEISHQPYILRLISEFIGLHNIYPEPEDPESMESLFYSDDREEEKNTIMYRMGIHGNILDLFSSIIQAFPSANSELSDREFQDFSNNQYFRPILYSGIILKVRRRMISVYKINSVYVPLLSLLFSHISMPNEKEIDNIEEKKRIRKDAEQSVKEEERRSATGEEGQRALGDAKRGVKEDVEKKGIVEYNGVKIIKSEMDVLTELEKDVGKIPIVSSIKNNVFGVMIVGNHVFSLVLYDKGLTSLPDAIGQLTSLTNLDLRNNQLTTLPNTISQLTSLTNLDLRYNQFTSLPDAIGQLTALKELYCGYNKLESLPDTIGQLTTLKQLYLYENQLTELPAAIGQLTSLEKLDLYYNKLKSIPETIGRLTSLTYLSISDNQLTSLPETIGQLTSLTYLDLGKNLLTSLPDVVKNALNKLKNQGCSIYGYNI